MLFTANAGLTLICHLKQPVTPIARPPLTNRMQQQKQAHGTILANRTRK
jgi:hypothetical protein